MWPWIRAPIISLKSRQNCSTMLTHWPAITPTPLYYLVVYWFLSKLNNLSEMLRLFNYKQILTDPASGMTVNADDYSDKSIGFTWSLNDTRCLNYIDAFTLNVYNLANFQNQTSNYSKDCFNVTNDSISFDTSNACSTITIEPCTVYSIEIRPIISNFVLTLKGNSDSTTTVASKIFNFVAISYRFSLKFSHRLTRL